MRPLMVKVSSWGFLLSCFPMSFSFSFFLPCGVCVCMCVTNKCIIVFLINFYWHIVALQFVLASTVRIAR